MLGNRVFRVFVSSTFRDLKVERDALQEKVFPELRAHCAANGYAFQAVDLRWGIREEASAGQRTMRICLSEVARCQEISPRPNFVVLLGDRYGWRPLPEVVDAAEFGALAALLAPPDRADAEASYYRDDNAVPPQYVLRPRGDSERPSDADALREALAEAARQAGLPGAAVARYTLSATEQEILKGAFEAEHAEEHVFCFLRDISGLPERVPPLPDDPQLWPQAASFCDFRADGTRDEESRALLGDLKSRLRQRLGGNAFGYQADWAGGAASTAHVDRLCQDMLSALTRVIDAEIARLGAYSHLDAERAAHGAFASEHTDGFTGRAGHLDAIDRYLDAGENHPLCVFAAGGLGKSALMARAAADAAGKHVGAVIVTRFIGVTPALADPRALLQDLCAEIGAAYGSPEPVPATLQELQQELPRRLRLASPDRPLVLFLDSLDQLAGGEGANLAWLPSDLPGSVRLVTTTRPGPCLGALASRLPASLVIELGPMPADEGETLLSTWLGKSGRTLQPGQRLEILGRFRGRGSPLYLRLAFEEARLWPSALEEVRIGDDEPSIIAVLYDRLEAEHGTELVGHALGFLACTYERLGLSEDEMLDALAADEETWAEFTVGARWELPVRRLPVVVWSRLYFDLAPYLSPRASEGASLLSFFHQELADAARQRYVQGRAPQLHGTLADVLEAQARGKDAGPRVWKGSAHPLAELPYHLTRAGRWDDLLATLTDFTYLEAKASRVAVVTTSRAGAGDVRVYNGVRALIDDYDRAIRGLNGPAGQAVGSLTAARADQRLMLGAFGKALAREAHNLTRRPDLLWQQMYNRLQWTDSQGKDGIKTQMLAPELAERSMPCARLWLHALTPIGESEALISTLTGHTGLVTALACSPDGTRIVSGSADKTLKIWDAASGGELATLVGHKGPVTAVAYCSDGTRIASGSADKTLKIWDAASGGELATLVGHKGPVTAVAYCSAGTRIASGSAGGAVKIWDAAGGAEVANLTGHANRVTALACSADGTRLVSSSYDKTVKIWDAATNAEIRTLTSQPRGANRGSPLFPGIPTDPLQVNAVALSPDSTRIASGSYDGTITIWDATTGAELATLTRDTGEVNAVAYSPDGTRIASGSADNTITIWDAATRAEVATLTGHTDRVTSLACSPDGTRIVSGSNDGTVKVWDAATAEVTTRTGHTRAVWRMAYSPDGTRIVTYGSRGDDLEILQVWDADTGAELGTLAGFTYGVKALAYSPDGTRIASGSLDHTIKIWDAASLAEVTTFTLRHDASDAKFTEAMACSPDGTRIVTSGSYPLGETLTVWDATGAELATLTGHTGPVDAVAYSPDGTRIVSGSLDKTLKVWDAASGAELATLTGHKDYGAVAYSPDGTRIASGSFDNTIKIWDAASGGEVAILVGHTDQVGALAYSPDGTRISSGSRDKTFRLWDIQKMECVAMWPCLGTVADCDYSPQGNRVCYGDESGLYILELIEGSQCPPGESF